jgi:2-(3-amino-3-carboxypropyl)histidine synthase
VKFSNYFIDIEKAISIIKKNNYKNVVIQLPEGLKIYSIDIINAIRNKTNCNIILIADPCFGSCDIPYNDLTDLKIDIIIHIGHLIIPTIKNELIPIIYLNAESIIDISKIVNKSIPYLKGKKIGVVTTAQHISDLDIIKNILKKNKLKPILSKGDIRISKTGQIIGCNYSSASKIIDKVESFLFVGSGNFHPIGLLLLTKKPVIAADPNSNEIKKNELELLRDKILKQRYGAIALSKKANNFGILISLKKGQQRFDLAMKVKELLDSYNKNNFLIGLNNFSPIYLESIKDIDCFISTSCPRIAIDDYILYKKPIITPIELEILFNIRKWEDYEFDQILA